MFTAFICLCAAAAGFAIGWCMARHIGKKDKTTNREGGA
jgi:hypothetical protein